MKVMHPGLNVVLYELINLDCKIPEGYIKGNASWIVHALNMCHRSWKEL